jgi:hypothetical protein
MHTSEKTLPVDVSRSVSLDTNDTQTLTHTLCENTVEGGQEASLNLLYSNTGNAEPFDRNDRRLRPTLFKKLEEKLRFEFDIDCCCNNAGTNKLCHEFLSPQKSFLDWKPITGKERLWINPPFDQIHTFVTHYVQLKKEWPGISACILTPVWQRNEWKTLMHDWLLVAQYDRNTKVFDVPKIENSGRWVFPPTKWKLEVHYDPPRDTSELPHHLLVASKQASTLSQRYKARLNDQPVTVLVDTGAGAMCYIDPREVQERNLQITRGECTVQVGGGATITVEGTVRFNLQLQKHCEDITAYVLKLPENIPMVLGDPWLCKHKAYIDYISKSLTLRHGKKCVTLTPVEDTPAAKKPRNDTQLLTLGEVHRVMHRIDSQKKLAAKHGTQYEPTEELLLAIISPHPEDEAEPEKPIPPEFKDILDKYQDVFNEKFTIPGECVIEPVIETEPGARAVNRPAFRYSIDEMETMKEFITDLLERQLIEPSVSPWGSPVIFVKKSDGTLRMCIDYRGVNKVTAKNSYPLPRIDDMVDALAGAKYFTSLDLSSAYHQIRLQDSDVPKTAFKTPFGLYQFKVLPFGLANAPAAMQAFMNRTFAKHLGKYAVIYLDDILIYSKTKEDHIKHVTEVLKTVQKANLYLKLECDFLKEELKFLGHIVGQDGVKPDSRKVQTVQDWPTPVNLTEIRPILGVM